MKAVLGCKKFDRSVLCREKQWDQDEKQQFYDQIKQQYEDQGHPYYSTARLWDDGVIDPADTRKVLSLAIESSARADVGEVNYGVFRM